MILIVMAHRGEAQSLIKHYPFKAHTTLKSTYIMDDLCLTLSGEGIYDCINHLTAVAQIVKPKLILNLGIAGALDPELKINSIYSIRTAYAFNETSPKFKSFTSKNSQKPNEIKALDCITTDFRVLSDETAKLLSPFAQIVDRELWAIGLVASYFNTPFSSYKLISDQAGANTQCFDLKEKAKEFSELILDFFLSLNNLDYKGQEKKVDDFEISFHASFTQKARIRKLAQKLSIETKEIEGIAKSLEIKNLKEKAAFVIESLENQVNPLKRKIEAAITNTTLPLSKIGARVIFDKNFETQKFTLQMEINSAKNIENLKKALEEFDHEKVFQIWDGKF